VPLEQKVSLEFGLEGSNFDGAGEASSKIKRTLQQLGVRPDIIRRIAISAYEAEMNVIIHAFRGFIRADIYSDHTHLTVQDEGPGIGDVSLAMKEGFSTAPAFVREMGFGAGMGLPNMARCADDFKIESQCGQGTKLSIIINH